MGFPDWFRLNPRKSQALKQFGNAVVVDVIQRVAMSIATALRTAEASQDTELLNAA